MLPKQPQAVKIGLVEEGDIIDIDIPAAKVNVRVSDEELAERKKALCSS